VSDVLLLARLALATAVVLAPGWAVARALGLRGASATVVWGLTLVFGALAITFAVGTGLTVTLVLLLVAGGCALPFALRARRVPPLPGWSWVAAAGVLLGLLLWHVAGEVGGDGFFHLARVRKLLAFDDLSLRGIGEFVDGGLHPGYAFPLWHGFLALVAKVAMVDPRDVVLHEASVLAPVAVLVAYEAGLALFRSAGPAAIAAAAQVTLIAFAPGHGGAYTALGLPATASRQILVPAALALVFAAVAQRSRAAVLSAAAAGFVLAVVHPTYAIFLWIPLAGFLVVRWAWMREDARAIGAALAALVVPAGLFFVWLLPVVRDTVSHSPGGDEVQRAIAQYRGQLTVHDDGDRYALAPALFGRGGAVAVAALMLVPFAALASRRRWAAYVVGGSMAVLVLGLTPWLFTPFSDLVSLSQSRRAAGFVPLAFAFAGGLAVLSALLRRWLLPLALAAGIVLQWLYPGDFDYVLTTGGPALATWIAALGAVIAVVVGLRKRLALERAAGLAAALFLLPVVVHGLTHWSPSEARRPDPIGPGLREALRDRLPAGAVLFSDLESSYRAAAAAPIYVAAAPPGHVADTKENRPYARRDDVRRFFATGDLAIPRRYGAGWLLIDRQRFPRRFALPVEYRDGRYTLYRLGWAREG
jgi:hypothetical protein